MARPDACSTRAHTLDEPLPGTAPQAVGWVLVEDPGPWGHDALADGTLPAAVRARFADWPKGVRFQAIRRGSQTVPGPRQVFLVHAGRTPWARRFEVLVDDLVDLDPEATLRPEPPADGEPHDTPLVLVCTHGRRDACCAELGRPTSLALREALADVVWETSHTGGHRFAPNVVVLPDGAVYGHLEVERAVDVVRDHLAGRLSLPHLRGHAGDHRAVQAAEVEVRRRHDRTTREDVDIVGSIVTGRDAVVMATAWHGDEGEHVKLTLREEELEPRPVSCGADPKDPGSWTIVDRATP